MRRLVLRWIGVCLSCLLCCSILQARTASMTRAELSRSLLDSLGTKRAECTEVLVKMAGTGDTVCAESDLPWKPFKKALGSEMRALTSGARHPDWLVERGRGEIRVLALDGPLRILFERRSRQLALVHGHPCFDAALLEALAPRTTADEAITQPEMTRRTKPIVPYEARRQRVEGYVVLDAIIGKNGRVEDLCVIHVSRHGLGAEEAAMKAVRKWRYKPATIEGSPVNVILTVTVSWSFGL